MVASNPVWEGATGTFYLEGFLQISTVANNTRYISGLRRGLIRSAQTLTCQGLISGPVLKMSIFSSGQFSKCLLRPYGKKSCGPKYHQHSQYSGKSARPIVLPLSGLFKAEEVSVHSRCLSWSVTVGCYHRETVARSTCK